MQNCHACQRALKIHHVYGVKDGVAARPLPGSAEECRRRPSVITESQLPTQTHRHVCAQARSPAAGRRQLSEGTGEAAVCSATGPSRPRSEHTWWLLHPRAGTAPRPRLLTI